MSRPKPEHNYELAELDTAEFMSLFEGKQVFVVKPENSEYVKTLTDPNKKALHKNPWHKHVDNIQECVGMLYEQNEAPYSKGIYFAVNELDKELDPDRKRTQKMLIRIRAVWVDDDTTGKYREDFPIAPNVIIKTSSTSEDFHKFQYIWLTTTDDFSEWDLVMNTMTNQYGGDKGARDRVRILRLPGFYHNKAEPQLVTAVLGGREPYSWEEITAAFPPSERVADIRTSGGKEPVVNLMNPESKSFHENNVLRGVTFHRFFQYAYRMKSDIGNDYKSTLEYVLEIMNRSEAKEKGHDRHDDWLNLMADDHYEIRRQLKDFEEKDDVFNRPIPVPILEEMAQDLYLRQNKQSIRVARLFTIMAAARGTSGIYFDDWMNLPSAVFALVIGDTTFGKEALNKLIHELYSGLRYIKFNALPQSPQGLNADLQDCNSASYFVDEFGRVMNAREKMFTAIMTELMQLYGRHQSEYIIGSTTRNKTTEEERLALKKPVQHPTPCLIGTSTWTAVRSTLGDQQILEGFVNRFFCAFIDEHIPRNYEPVLDNYPAKYKSHVSVMRANSKSRNALLSNRKTVHFPDDVREFLKDFSETNDNFAREKSDKIISALVGRVFENSIRLVNVLSAWAEPEDTEANIPIAEYCTDIIAVARDKLIREVLRRDISDNAYDIAMREISTYLNQQKEKEASITDLQKHCTKFKYFKLLNHTPAQARRALLDEMSSEEIGLVELRERTAKGAKRPSTFVKLVR